MFVKEVPADIANKEVAMQVIASKYGFSPKIIGHTIFADVCFISMEHLEAECIADIYGENPEDIPCWIWNEIRAMLRTLLDEEGIEYLDITPYNFIEKDNRIYVVDFGDAKYVDGKINWFLDEFLEGENSWNPDYK
jgi:tRNA A-37 threonylcarbamoyl transferase component Bud32